MIALPQTVKIMLFAEAVELRKGFHGLGALVLSAGEDLYSGHLYVLISKRRDRVKILSIASPDKMGALQSFLSLITKLQSALVFFEM